MSYMQTTDFKYLAWQNRVKTEKKGGSKMLYIVNIATNLGLY